MGSKLTLNDQHPNESKGLRNQQKMQVLMQAESLWGWIMNKVAPENVSSIVSGGKGGSTARFSHGQTAEGKNEDRMKESNTSLPGIRKAPVKPSPRMHPVAPS